jgi:hypothetical protein
MISLEQTFFTLGRKSPVRQAILAGGLDLVLSKATLFCRLRDQLIAEVKCLAGSFVGSPTVLDGGSDNETFLRVALMSSTFMAHDRTARLPAKRSSCRVYA